MAKYDPKKQYKWDPDTEFVLHGEEFGLILNTFRNVLNTPKAREIIMLDQANQQIEQVLKRNVESGVVKEAPAPPPPAPVNELKVVDAEEVETES